MREIRLHNMSVDANHLVDISSDSLPKALHVASKIEANDNAGIPLQVARYIALNLQSVPDLIAFSTVCKNCYIAVYENEAVWVNNLRLLGLWDTAKFRTTDEKVNSDQLVSFEVESTPLNCFQRDRIIQDQRYAFLQFKTIYKQTFPIFQDLIIVNRSNFSNSRFLKQYDTPESQVIIFNNLTKFLNIFHHSPDYKNYSVRLNTIVDIFTNSVLKEIESNLNSEEYSECLRFIRILGKLSDNGISSTALELVLEFFIDRYVSDYNVFSTNETINSCFIKKTNKTHINYERVSEVFNQIKDVLNKEFKEIRDIFESEGLNSMKDPNVDITEAPIILKLVENFLQNVVASKFLESLIDRAALIDEQEENVVEEIRDVSETQSNASTDDSSEEITTPVVENNEWSDIASPISVEPVKEEKKEIPPEAEETEKGVEEMSNAALYFQMVPYLYRKLIELFNSLEFPGSVITEPKAKQSHERKPSVGSAPIDYRKISVDLVDFYYQQFLSDFIGKLPKLSTILCDNLVTNWKSNQNQKEQVQNSQIMDLVGSTDSKNKNLFKLDIFTGFSKIFKVGNLMNGDNVSDAGHKNLTKNEANLKILTANLNNIKTLISLDLSITLLKTLKESFHLLLSLTGRNSTKQHQKRRVGEYLPATSYGNEDLKHRVNITCQEMFNDMLNILIEKHIKVGFDTALKRLRTYKPTEFRETNDHTLDPIVNFIELVNVGDLIQQMISLFYREELINTNIVVQRHKVKRDFLMANKCEKTMRKFETLLDNYVADGLNISIDVLMSEISFGVMTEVSETNFNITEADLIQKRITLGEPSKIGRRVLLILESHVNLLTGSIDKAIVDVFQQEIGERFVGILIKLITKDLIISTTGAVILISDLNAYFNFFLKMKIKSVLSFLTALKSIAQLYLIDSSNSKDIGKLVVKIGRENGIFNQEEIYEFVTRRADWEIIQKDVDKIMYGLGLTDCTLM